MTFQKGVLVILASCVFLIYVVDYQWQEKKIHFTDLTSALIDNVEGERIAKNLRNFTTEPHTAGSAANFRVAQKIVNIWKENGLENVHFVKYNVLLNYPNYEDPNIVTIFNDKTNKTIFKSAGYSPVILPKEQGAKDAGIQWLAYSPSGLVEGDVVYCHYGNKNDFELLRKMGISIKGKIALMRYDGKFRAMKVFLAKKYGAIGAILYSDPAECAADGVNSVYPNTVWMPSGGVQRGCIKKENGDSLTPLYPSRKDLFRSKTIEEVRETGDLPSIPSLPLSYADAYHILSRLGGPPAPAKWRGGLNITYNIGPGFRTENDQNSLKLRLKVNSYFQHKEIRNVIGYIYGAEEPDEYIMVGNHFDAWVYGAIDPNSGTAILAEVARAMTKTMRDTAWRPARTIMFCAWDAEEYGLIGSTEFVEDFVNILSDRVVAYLNVDLIVANRTFNANTIPQLYDVVVETSRRIPNPMQEELNLGRKTIYDTWLAKHPGHYSWLPNYPNMRIPGGGSDHSSFLIYAGIPVVDFSYRNNSENYPLYHTLYETPFVNEQLYDPNHFAVHRAVAQYWAELTRRFSDDNILPINVSTLAQVILADYVANLKRSLDDVKDVVQELKAAKQQLTFLIRKCQEFISVADAFMSSLHKDNISARFTKSSKNNAGRDLAAKRANQRLKAVDRCFINPRGSSKNAAMRHVLYSLNEEDIYSSNVMPPVYSQLEQLINAKTAKEKQKAGHDLAQEISIVQYSVQCAINTLADGL